MLSVFSSDAVLASQPTPWQLGFQTAATEVMEDIHWFNNFTLIIISAITLLVLVLLVYCIARFNSRANPKASRTSHNVMIEVVWTVVPILLLVIISIPSFRLLFKQQIIPEYDMAVKATGYQWYWGYEYVDEGLEDIYFDSLMLSDEDRAEKMAEEGLSVAEVPRLLAADYNLVVPVDTTVLVQVTAADVIHSFAMPAFGVKVDAVPGRLNETWFNAQKTGMYYGQCSELCGQDHAFMPIAIQVVTKEQYAAWAEAAKNDIDDANALLASLVAAGKKQAEADRNSNKVFLVAN
ncbi:cytochrome c oxidase subunit II [Flexibacterium corallicola]|uniref:cytochrome c oxidase subunit II n=1 Tax=Flexibacterium corallicola TaxID=3037259 RepID=UPI00286EBBBB|nr:cytochrome c oxidase subunit II [Pseudovibrio sp. M1P-2-3]